MVSPPFGVKTTIKVEVQPVHRGEAAVHERLQVLTQFCKRADHLRIQND